MVRSPVGAGRSGHSIFKSGREWSEVMGDQTGVVGLSLRAGGSEQGDVLFVFSLRSVQLG